MSQLIILDNEAVQALADADHRKHRRMLSYLQVITTRKSRSEPVRAAVPTAVRVESGWDRTSPRWAFVNRLRISDIVLDTATANTAAAARAATAVSVADAHIAAAIATATADRIMIITSDPGDIRRIAGDRSVTVVPI